MIQGEKPQKGKNFNRLVNNKWKRNLFINNLKKRCDINEIRIYEINPAYSSYIGNLMNDCFDPINSSLEIGRRGYEIFIKKRKQNFYPKFRKDSLKHQWKEMVNEFEGWIEFCKWIKNSKLKYRVFFGRM